MKRAHPAPHLPALFHIFPAPSPMPLPPTPVVLLFSSHDLGHASELAPCISHTAWLPLMSVSVLGLPQCPAQGPRSVNYLDEFLMPEISRENSLSFFCRISDTKPVTSHVEWPSFLRTKTETGTEMSVPVSIHIAVTLLPFSCRTSQSGLL